MKPQSSGSDADCGKAPKQLFLLLFISLTVLWHVHFGHSSRVQRKRHWQKFGPGEPQISQRGWLHSGYRFSHQWLQPENLWQDWHEHDCYQRMERLCSQWKTRFWKCTLCNGILSLFEVVIWLPSVSVVELKTQGCNVYVTIPCNSKYKTLSMNSWCYLLHVRDRNWMFYQHILDPKITWNTCILIGRYAKDKTIHYRRATAFSLINFLFPRRSLLHSFMKQSNFPLSAQLSVL